jgi:uroporphyrinogen-III synthase
VDLPTSPAVVLTRESEDNAGLLAALEERAVPVVELPCVATRFLAPRLPSGRADAVLFTSRRGVLGLQHHPEGRAWLEARRGTGARPLLGVVGTATAAALQAWGWTADVVAQPPDGRTLGREVAGRLARGTQAVLVRGNLGTGELERALGEAGIGSISVVIYENASPAVPALGPFPVAAVFVASPSAARRLLEANPWMAQHAFLTIGLTTLKAVRELGVSRARAIGVDLDEHVAALTTAHEIAVTKEDA